MLFSEMVSKAVQLDEAAVAIQPRNEDYLDTEACAYAESGNFVKATEIEDQVVQVMPTDDFIARRNGFHNQKACHDDVQPQVRQKTNTRLQGNHQMGPEERASSGSNGPIQGRRLFLQSDPLSGVIFYQFPPYRRFDHVGLPII
jgi:hypothetical protein